MSPSEHFGVFQPVGVVLGGYLQGQQGQVGQGFVELFLEYVGAEGIEYPFAASGTGINAGEDGHGVAAEHLLQVICGSAHGLGVGIVRHTGRGVLPGHVDAYFEFGVVAERGRVAPSRHHNQLSVGAFGRRCTPVFFHGLDKK